MASIAVQVPSPRPQGPESLLMTLGAGLTPKRSSLSPRGSGGGKGTNRRAISNAHMSEVMVKNSRIQINNSTNIVSLVAKRPDPSNGSGPQTN